MGLNSEDPIKYIKHLLESKSTAKQTAYKHICRAFSILSDEQIILLKNCNEYQHRNVGRVAYHYEGRLY